MAISTRPWRHTMRARAPWIAPEGVPRYRETREYVQKVTDSYFRPGSDRLPHAFDAQRPIYRTMVEADGRVVFTNE